MTTPVRIAPRDWSSKHERLKPSVPGATEINAALQALKAHAESLMIMGKTDAEIRQSLKARMGVASEKTEPRLLDLFDAFLKQKEARTRSSTVQVYTALRGHLEEWLGPDARLERIGPGFLDDFATYLAGQGLANSTVNKLITRAKGYLRWLKSRRHLETLPETKALPTARNRALYLSANELARLVALDLSGEQPGYGAARDLFVLGCCTGQRYSDLQAMTWEQIDDGATWWNVPVKKTGVVLRVPLTGPARRIIQARRGNAASPAPRLSNQKCNAFIKQVCKRAGLDTPVTQSVLRGGSRETETLPKWRVVSTHAARRTFVTLALQKGLPMNELLGFTHDDLRTLRLYAGQSDEHRKKHVDRIFGTL